MTMYRKLNLKLPSYYRRLIGEDSEPMKPTEWCDTLEAISDESLDCIFHVFAKWRLEGTGYHIDPLTQQDASGK